MKIGLILPSLFASKKLYPDRIFAPANLLTQLSNGLVDKGHEVFVFSVPDFKTKAKLLPSPIDVVEKRYPYHKFNNLDDPHRIIQTEEVYRRIFEIDVITSAFKFAHVNQLDILHCYHDSIFFSVHYLNQLFNLPVIYSLHDPIPPANSIEFEQLTRFKDHFYIALSTYMKKSSDSLNFVDVIHHGVNIEDFKFYPEQGGDLILAGRYIPEKGFKEAITLAVKLKKRLTLASSQDYHLGEYYNTDLKPLIKQYSNLIIEKKYLAEPQMNEFYGQGKLFLFPLQWEEPFGMTLIESMACGTPVVAYARGSVADIIQDGVTGFIVNSSEEDKRGDWIIKKTGTEGLIEAVEKIYSLPADQYQQMRKKCREHVEKNFTVEKMVEKFEVAYIKVIGSNLTIKPD